MRITAKHMTYFSILEAMQNIDHNGTWDEMSDDLKDGNVTLSEVKEVCKETLERWLLDTNSNSIRNLMRLL